MIESAKDFFHYIKQYISFLYNKTFKSSKYVLKGKCKQCGQCCRNIVFMIEENYVNTEEQFELLKEFKKIYSHFYISGRDKDRALLFTCKSLGEDNKCRDYRWRSFFCRNYPQIIPKFIYRGGKPLDNCGYSFEINKKFNEFIK